jgi:hypothetical protein
MPYNTPTFNLPINVWHNAGVVPPVGLPSLTLFANMTPGRRNTVAELGALPGVPSSAFVFILVPMRSDVRDQLSVAGPDTIECPAASGCYYVVLSVVDVARGFANEYRQALAYASARPTPLP